MPRIKHPTVVSVQQKIQQIKKRKEEKINVILFFL